MSYCAAASVLIRLGLRTMETQAPIERTVLVVDDDPSMIDLFTHLLCKEPGVNVVTAVNGREAIAVALRERPDLILLDHDMPEMDGFSACQIISQALSAENLEIWFVTGTAHEADVAIAQEAGAKRIISKPVDQNQLRTEIREALSISDDAAAA